MKKAFTSICNIVSAPIVGSLSGLATITGSMALCIVRDATSFSELFSLSGKQLISYILGQISDVFEWLSFIFSIFKFAKEAITTPNYFSNFDYIPIVSFYSIILFIIIVLIIQILYMNNLDKSDSKTMKIISISIYSMFLIYTTFHLSYSTIKGLLESHFSFSINSRIGLYYILLSVFVLIKIILSYILLDTEETKEKEQQKDTTMFHCSNYVKDFDANRYDIAMFHCSNCGDDFEAKRYITRKTFDAENMTTTIIYFPMKCPNCGDWATTPKTIQQHKVSCTEA